MAKAQFCWEDPLLLDAQLTSDERLIRDAARDYCQGRLLPRVQEAFRHERTDPAIFREMGAMGLLGGMVISFIIAGIQGQAPEALRGRIMSIYSIISQVVPAASGVAAGALVRATGVTQAILYAGVGLAGLALLGATLMPQLRRVAR